MQQNNSTDATIKKLEKLLRSRMRPLYERYNQSIDGLLIPLKWKPLVLIIGNYSSGKSTFINEVLGMDVQRTGQAPTDDCFTILTIPEAENDEKKKIPGSTVVNDERLPFTPLKPFGENLFSHLRLKKVNSSVLEHFAIIDTPGMLDSVTEKDRGYNYLKVVGELARISDMIILMFDPHKAGTIKETYKAIRSTLPDTAGEDRIFYVLNRIDECDNVADLVKSYGTLCWNLSQMTGRKDIPRVFLTYSESESRFSNENNSWVNEQEELKQAVHTAPQMRLSHIFEEIDRGVREFSLQVEAFETFRNRFNTKLKGIFRVGVLGSFLAFFFGDIILNMFSGIPETPLALAAFSGSVQLENLYFPLAGITCVFIILFLYVQQFLYPRHVKKSLAELDTLVELDTTHRNDLWGRVRDSVRESITEQAKSLLMRNHSRILKKINKFLEKDIRRLFEKTHKH